MAVLLLRPYSAILPTIGAVSKLGFWFKVKAAVRFQPEEYARISRIETECPTPRLDQKTI